jgi:dUTP pyrophosphatase
MLIPTGVFVQLPPGMVLLVCPRSGLALNDGLTVVNAPGIIDSDYRGEIGVIVHCVAPGASSVITPGMRIAQALLVESCKAVFTHVETLDESARGTGGFGSTGVN